MRNSGKQTRACVVQRERQKLLPRITDRQGGGCEIDTMNQEAVNVQVEKVGGDIKDILIDPDHP